MEFLTSISETIKIPKQIIDDAEALAKKILGPSIDEFGGIINDQIRFLRFKNQLAIFGKAAKSVKESGIDPRKINLKVLVPLIDALSLEEDTDVQNSWANLVANISTSEENLTFEMKCIESLKFLSREEIRVLDKLFELYNAEAQTTIDEMKRKSGFDDSVKFGVHCDNSLFDPAKISSMFAHDQMTISLYLDHLMSSYVP